MDFEKKAKTIAKKFQTIDQLSEWIEKALKEAWNEGISKSASIATQNACGPMCHVPAIERAIRALVVTP